MSALAMATVASAGVDTFCSNPNFCVFERETPELLFCLDKQEVGSGPSRCVLTSPLAQEPRRDANFQQGFPCAVLCSNLKPLCREPAVVVLLE